MAEVRVGISGWTYAGWRGDFYPEGLAHRKELAYAAGKLTSIEINGSFYSLQRPTSYAKWRDETPDDFVFAVKGGRYITHMKRLVGAESALANFFASGVLALGPKLGPILWQLPPTLGYDAGVLADFFEQLPRTTEEAAKLARHHDEKLGEDRVLTETDADRPLRHALEVRHHSFDADDAKDLLRAHHIAFVVADTAGRYPLVDVPTSDFVYARLHGDTELYASGYSDEALDEWARRIEVRLEEGLDAFVYFDNDMKGYAPFDAMRLLERLGGR
ncbi:MAG: DUF72 domain-containing protein [Rhodococcus sp. (in: high G+C Gram-positive bacteria)]|uniref:DUF72 domain-containing protein n=1 Tax=Rhodococcus sp. TaxID=1831 RepID=UPI003BAF93B5